MGDPAPGHSNPQNDPPANGYSVLDSAKLRAKAALASLGSVPLGKTLRNPGRLALAGLGIVGSLFAAAIVVMLMIAPGIPEGADLYALNRPPALTFTDQKGDIVGVRGAIVGERLKLNDMPRYLPAAFMAMEDRNFYHHPGVDPNGLLRAAWVDLKAGHIVQGGSTITQQVVKIVLLTPDRTFSRKLQEIGGAFALESKLRKNEILDLYLNRIYLGSGSYGVDGAATVYFGKSARNVTLSEAAMLAALTRAPSAFSPRRDLASAQMRAGRVLDAMVATGAITTQQADEARANPATVIDPTQNLARDYFLDAASDEVKTLAPYATGDLTITTTMNPALQEAARQQVASVLERKASIKAHATQAALVSMTTDGAVRALIGGKDYAESSFNRVTKAHRQPGSAFKPFVYLTALETGLTPYTVRVDEPIKIKDWAPDNYTEMNLGPISLEEAFTRSINTVAVQLGLEVGLPRVISVAHRLGIDSMLQPVASLSLGTSEVTPLELTGAYAAFANMGTRVRPYTVLEIRKPDGTQLYRRNAPVESRVIAEPEGLAMNEMMYQVVQTGTGRAAMVPGHEVAGKTGTSADYRDAWFVGFSPEFVTGVWVGNDDFTAMKKVTGGSLPAQIWSGYMRVALKNVPPTPLPRALPPPPENPDVAADTGDSDKGLLERGIDGIGHGIGSFFNHLFGGTSADAAETPASHEDRSANANDGRHYFPEESNPSVAMDDLGAYQQMPESRVGPALAPRFAEQRGGTRGTEAAPTFVFQNGETGERQVFRSGARNDQDGPDRFASRRQDYDRAPHFAAPRNDSEESSQRSGRDNDPDQARGDRSLDVPIP